MRLPNILYNILKILKLKLKLKINHFLFGNRLYIYVTIIIHKHEI